MPTVTIELYYDGAWNAVSGYEAEGWSYKVGPSDLTGTEPNSMTVTLANDNLALDPSNASSPLYGKIGPNTPVRLSIDGTVVMSGEASSWKPERSIDHVAGSRGRSWVTLEAEGILRRLSKWDESSTSPMARQIRSYSDLSGLWRMEDPAGTPALANDVTSGKTASITPGVALGADEGPAGALSALTITAADRISSSFYYVNPAAVGYQICFAMKLDAVPASGTYIAVYQWNDYLNRTWYFRVNNVGFQVECQDEFGASLATNATTFGAGVDVTQWIRYRMKVYQPTGSSVSCEVAWYPQDASVIYLLAATFSSVVTSFPRSWSIIGNAHTDNAAYSMLFAVFGLTLDLIGSYPAYAAFNGYNAEGARDRFIRLMTENGIDYQTLGGVGSLAATMGRQPRATLVDILDELAFTEAGLIFDDPIPNASAQQRLVFKVNRGMVFQNPVLNLTYGVNVAYPLRKVIDDQRAPNDITGVNWDGTEARVTQTTGRRSISQPPAGVGRYPGRIEVSLKWPDKVIQRTQWEVAANTQDKPRYPTVKVDLLANPSLRATVATMRPGDLITISGADPDTVNLLVVQIERSGNAVLDSVTFNCLPGDIFLAGFYDSPSAGYYVYDSASTTLSAGVNSTAVTLPIFTADVMEKWTSAAVGCPIMVNGERMTITAVSAGAASGTGWAQNLTVTRSANGVVNSHLTGEQVNVAYPARYILKSQAE